MQGDGATGITGTTLTEPSRRILFFVQRNIFYLDLAVAFRILRTAGFSVELIVGESQTGDLRERLRQTDAFCLGTWSDIFDIYNDELDRSLSALKLFKELHPDRVCFFMGLHSTIYPELIARYPFVDAAFVGDVERNAVPFFEAVRAGHAVDDIPGLRFRRDGRVVSSGPAKLTDLTQLPPPDLETFLKIPGAFRYGVRIPFGRGCPNRCSFCFNPRIGENTGVPKGDLPRYYPPSYLVEVVKSLLALNDPSITSIYFIYGTFSHSKKFLREFAEAYRDIGFPYLCTTRLNNVDDEVARLLRETNCTKVTVAIESGVERLRNGVLRKDLSDKQIYRGMATLKRHGLRVGCNVMMGFPDESLEDAFTSLDMARSLNADYVVPGLYQPIPGTDLARYAVERGCITAEYDLSVMNYETSMLDIPDRRRIVNLCSLSSLYMALPLRPLFRVLLHLPPNRFFLFFKFLPKLKTGLRFEMKERSLADKVGFVLHHVRSTLLLNSRPSVIPDRPSQLNQEANQST